MFDFGFSEMLLAGVVALIVLGPERLPVVARAAGRWLGKIQAFAAGVKQELNRSGGLDELRGVQADFEQAAQDIRSDWYGVQTAAKEAARLPAWERLPEMKTPADFGMDENGSPLPEWEDGLLRGHTVSLQKQAALRRRDMRPRVRIRPKLRVRRKAR
ncbi:MAG: Sec-independent protein translocase protein TatB [Neisseria sp.]|nr:Sec-independent protein translocase protein TatB [Neisseria sp.]